jgi:hypothetical protein
MKRTLLALSVIAALTAVSAGMANAQEVGDGPGGYVGPDHDQGFHEERGFHERDGNCHLVIMHRRAPNGSITVRRRVCD